MLSGDMPKAINTTDDGCFVEIGSSARAPDPIPISAVSSCALEEKVFEGTGKGGLF